MRRLSCPVPLAAIHPPSQMSLQTRVDDDVERLLDATVCWPLAAMGLRIGGEDEDQRSDSV